MTPLKIRTRASAAKKSMSALCSSNRSDLIRQHGLFSQCINYEMRLEVGMNIVIEQQ